MTDAPPAMELLGYCDRPSVRPGETIDFHVSCGLSEGYDADLVRLRHGDLAPDGPGMKLEHLASELDGHYAGEARATPAGSFAVLPARRWLPKGGWTVAIRACPWTTGRRRETLLRCVDDRGRGLTIHFEDQRFHAALTTGAGTVQVSGRVRAELQCWYELRVSARAGALALAVGPVGHPDASRLRFRDRSGEVQAAPLSAVEELGEAELWLAAEPASRGAPFAANHYNGKLEGPRFYGSEAGDRLHAVDFAAELGEPARHRRCSALGRAGAPILGTIYNQPTRAVTGSEWTSGEDDFRAAPEKYAAVHFHEDDLADATWPVSHSFTVPADLASGIYALRLRGAAAVDYVPFVVRPGERSRRAPIAVVIPTATYLAYANDKFGPDVEMIQLLGRIPVLGPEAMHGHLHRELGSSIYDVHPDGSGVCFSSWRRPLLNVRPGRGMALLRTWNFNTDLQLVDWLTEKGFAFDVVTDHDLHAEGLALTRFRGHLTAGERSSPERSPSATNQTALPTGVS